ncbi:MAG: 6-phosphogluconolactonase, partial [Nitrospira sp.]|nr:6-phosphogluconolactonase [Nitrospira sp.]
RDLQEAAREYERQLRNVTKTAAPDQPQIDLVLLGLGEDGHVASLFPGTASLQDRRSVIIVTHSPKDPPVRLSMTLGVINRASVVLFLVVGAGKAGVVRGVLDPKSQVERHLPAALVAPDHGRLIWLLDPAAAAALR